MQRSIKKDELPILRISVRIYRPIDEVWENFLDPLLMTQWLGNEISADMREGGTIRFSGKNAPTNAEMENFWTLKRYKEERALLLSWGLVGVDTLFLLSFKEMPAGTIMDIRHGPIPSSANKLHLSDHWTLLLTNFKSIVELGEPAYRFDYTDYRPLRVTRYDPTEVRHSVLIRAPPQLPFDVFTNPEKLRHFIRADEPVIDRQYAGIYTWWAEGKGPVVFTKMEPEKEIEFTWVYGDEAETKVNIRFEEVDEDTLVSLHHFDFQKPEDVVGYNIGWASILSELKLVCELGESGIERSIEWE
ncbi:SRPBCC domain-containing protein [Candidatus Thorarchaeota archaeon]|nr:MAG: SRPBCC domain-containing protein [Candidatus Thorarchaeota archaeon]